MEPVFGVASVELVFGVVSVDPVLGLASVALLVGLVSVGFVLGIASVGLVLGVDSFLAPSGLGAGIPFLMSACVLSLAALSIVSISLHALGSTVDEADASLGPDDSRRFKLLERSSSI